MSCKVLLRRLLYLFYESVPEVDLSNCIAFLKSRLLFINIQCLNNGILQFSMTGY